MWRELTKCVRVPMNTEALLFDLDGVLIDSLQLDLNVCEKILNEYARIVPGKARGSAKDAAKDTPKLRLSRIYLQSIFALDIESFWRRIVDDAKLKLTPQQFTQLVAEYRELRVQHAFPLTPGIYELLSQCRQLGLPMAVVSNNAREDIKTILAQVELADFFGTIVGNDQEWNGVSMRKKPAPDTYLYASEQLGVAPDRCVVFEDSEIGVDAGLAAGCFIVAVATGGATSTTLTAAVGKRGEVYQSFLERVSNGEVGVGWINSCFR